MIPIVILSLVLWLLIVERYRRLKMESTDSDILTDKIIGLVRNKKKGEAIDLCMSSSGIAPESLKEILVSHKTDRDSLVKSVQVILLKGYSELEKHLSTIGALASSAPLLGLLGTVTGMVSTFNSIALHGTGDPDALALGISEALITTESGLIVAIPALFLYSQLVKRKDAIINNLQKNANKLVNFVTRENGNE